MEQRVLEAESRAEEAEDKVCSPLLWHTSSQTFNQISASFHRLTHYQNIIRYTTLWIGCT